MRRQIPGKEWPASDGSKNASPCAAFPVGRILSLPIVAALAIHLFIGTTTALAAETENAGRTVQQEAGLNRGSSGFDLPVSTADRRFIDQTDKICLLKTMSSWAMSQNCSEAEITQALEGLKALRFNAITVSPFGVHMNDSFATSPKTTWFSRDRSCRSGR